MPPLDINLELTYLHRNTDGSIVSSTNNSSTSIKLSEEQGGRSSTTVGGILRIETLTDIWYWHDISEERDYIDKLAVVKARVTPLKILALRDTEGKLGTFRTEYERANDRKDEVVTMFTEGDIRFPVLTYLGRSDLCVRRGYYSSDFATFKHADYRQSIYTNEPEYHRTTKFILDIKMSLYDESFQQMPIYNASGYGFPLFAVTREDGTTGLLTL